MKLLTVLSAILLVLLSMGCSQKMEGEDTGKPAAPAADAPKPQQGGGQLQARPKGNLN